MSAQSTIKTKEQRRSEFRALVEVRNKKQRKADAKREALHERAREAWVEAFGAPPPDMRTPLAAQPGTWTPWVSPLVDGAMPRAESWGPSEATPLQRLMRFAADTGEPVSFEIAEKAMKGGG